MWEDDFYLVDLYERHDFIKINKTGDLNQLIMFLE